MRHYNLGYPTYVSSADKKAKASKSLEKLKKKNPNINPVIIEGNTIAKTWWGKAWIKNIESYADYTNRLGRGRAYVKNGAVLDLQIDKGKVKALVQGTRSEPYRVEILFQKLNMTIWKNIKNACQGSIESVQDLLNGKFPKDIGEIFTKKGDGLFPAPKEITFQCSCPDWADMCKHVASVLYAIGARFDEDAGLFFNLREIEVSDLIKHVVTDKATTLVEASKKAKSSSRVLDFETIMELFEIEMDNYFKTTKDVVTEISKTDKNSKQTKKVPDKKVVKKTKKSLNGDKKL
ncbi:MAG: SWIM zinc finger family protein [Thermodesulfovibrionales bacterium]|nr:SWIM zinc finger family protein [Thermodesulfovibrionales bacterium]